MGTESAPSPEGEDEEQRIERLLFLEELERRELALHHAATPPPPPGSRKPWGLVLLASVVVFAAVLVPGNQVRRAMEAVGLREPHQGPAIETTGPHTFLMHQADGVSPVGWDPCLPVEYAVNPQDAPDDWDDVVDPAVAKIEAATGLDFEYVGTTDERPFEARYLARRAPVVIGWGDSDEFPALAGDTAGLGGSTVRNGAGQKYFVTGSIALDTELFDTPGVPDHSLTTLVVHELGHVVGLDHVDDPQQLMHPEGTGFLRDLGPGDREGLAKLGQIPCG